jgi:hypothetical protein
MRRGTMLARLKTFHGREPVEGNDPRVARLRQTVKETPGYIAGYELFDDDTGLVYTLIIGHDGATHAEVGRRLAARADSDKLGVDPDEVQTLRAYAF